MDHFSLILGNFLSLLAMAANALSSTRKTTRGVLLTQCVSQFIYCATSIVLGAYSAATQNVVSILRNLIAIKNIKGKAVEWTMAVLGLVLGAAFNNHGIIGLLPVLGNFQYTLAIFRFRDNERAVKLSFLLSVLSFSLLNLAVFNFVGFTADLVVIATTAAVLLRGEKTQ